MKCLCFVSFSVPLLVCLFRVYREEMHSVFMKARAYKWKKFERKKNEEEKNENRIPCVLFCVHERLFNLTFYFNRLNWMRMLVSVTNCRLLTKEQSVRAVFDGINICNITYIFLCENCSAVLLCIELFGTSKKNMWNGTNWRIGSPITVFLKWDLCIFKRSHKNVPIPLDMC